jgi:hypothetical protein
MQTLNGKKEIAGACKRTGEKWNNKSKLFELGNISAGCNSTHVK